MNRWGVHAEGINECVFEKKISTLSYPILSKVIPVWYS